MRRGKKTDEEKEAERKEKESPTFCILTYRFRIKGGYSCRLLNQLSRITNLIWNFCNAVSFKAIRDDGKWLSQYDLNQLTTGTTKELDQPFHSHSVNAICEEYVTRRIQFKKRKLRWRTSQGAGKSLGWIPFKSTAVKLEGNQITYAGKKFKFWNSWDGKNPKQRKFEGEIASGSFSEDALGHWYLNLSCRVKMIESKHEVEEVGVDLGLKDSAVLSEGHRMINGGEYRELEEKLSQAQRAHKKRRIKKIHAKIKNRRKDRLHKETTQIAKKYKRVFVGNVSGKFLQTGQGKSSADASVGAIRNFLKYKALRHSGKYKEVNESSSTVTCSECLKKTGPSGLSDLGIREWTCSECHSHHDRDINAARNILRVGRDSLRAAQAA